jgi:methionine sulfoxide reductase heme-binding subunit
VIAAATNSRALWYLTRGTGLVSLLLLTATVVLGVLQVNRWSSPRWPRFVTAGLHKSLSLLVTAFLGVHIATTVIDGYVTIRWVDALVPFIGSYRPFWLGLGALAFDLLLALIVTSLLRERIGYRAWRAVHWAAYLCWPVALFHGLGTGTDTRVGVVLVLYLGSIAAVVGAVCWRLLAAPTALRPGPGADPTGTLTKVNVAS